VLRVRRLISLAVVAIVAACVIAAGFAAWPAAAQSTLPVRARLSVLAADGAPSRLPSADPGYCLAPGGPGSSPPVSFFGTLTVGGQPAPAGTVVQVTFDGKAGPARFTTQAGGYRLDYDSGGTSCVNRAGAAIGVLVDGRAVATGKKVGEITAGEPFRFDIAVP